MCGEKHQVGGRHNQRIGSPPRMRGKALMGAGEARFPRITPAYAGKSKFTDMAKNFYEDHPRVCGEKLALYHHRHPAQGSPPRMRGKVSGFVGEKFGCGITPAYAGKREPGRGLCAGVQDHPRVCGEKKMHLHKITAVQGSPPRMRGKD